MCIAFNCTTKEQLSSIVLDNNILPWVTKAKHIGNYLHEDGTTGYDLSVKRGIFIQTALEINQEFAYLPASIRVRLNNLYNSHFSGSCIWRFESVEADRLIGSWNKKYKINVQFALGNTQVDFGGNYGLKFEDYAVFKIHQVCQCYSQIK